MAAPVGFLRTRVGQRLFWRFLLAAFVPTMLTAGLAWYSTRSQMQGDIEAGVRQDVKMAGLNTLGTLERLSETLRGHVTARASGALDVPPGFDEIVAEPLPAPAAAGPDAGARPLSEAERSHLLSGRALIATTGPAGSAPGTWMAVLDNLSPDTVLWARLGARGLWGTTADAIRKEGTQLCVVDAMSDQELYCEESLPRLALQELRDRRGTGQTSLTSWTDDGVRRFAAATSLFLRFEYGASEWHVIVSERAEGMLAARRTFVTTLGGVSLLALLVVFLLSHSQIRRSTEPLEQLHEGTRRLAAGDFASRVEVSSGDEFADLASSFNSMARTLDRQLVTWRSLDALNQATLGAREFAPLLETALRQMSALTSADVAVVVDDEMQGATGLMQPHGRNATVPVSVALTDVDRANLVSRQGKPGAGDAIPASLAAALSRRGERTHLMPMVRENKFLGFVLLLCGESDTLSQDQLEAVRRLADRLTLAIADVAMLQHLAALSEGTLTAFARAIDANSPWTAGHSERVTAISGVIGQKLGLSSAELADLRCGGLLHDIGKIGVPPQILDKAGPLTEAERRIIEQHPVLGAEILSPIAAFNRAVPVVRSHHERLNGTGYPDGLAGDDIPLLARILAVADVFDALVSDRPYRPGLETATAVEIIERGVKSHFDPWAVAAFLAAVKAGEIGPLMIPRSNATDLASAVVASRRVIEEAA